MRLVTYGFWLLIILLGVSFAAINSHTVTINYYVASVDVYLPLLLLLELALGALLGVIAMLPPYLKIKNAARKSRLRVKQLEKEVENLRAIPIKDNH